MKKNILVILVLVLIAFGLRVLYIDCPLWYDEACSWMSASQNSFFAIMKNLFTLDIQHTPLYFFLLHIWMNIFGQGEIAMRCLSLIFGIGTIPLVYLSAKRLSAHTTPAVFASLVCVVSPLLVLFSSEVRMYSAVTFFVMLSFYFLVKFEQTSDKKTLLYLTLSNILIPYVYTGGIIFNLSLLLGYCIYLKQKKPEKFNTYIKFAKIEWICFIPYFILIGYYTKLRSMFIVSHEGDLRLFHITDIIRNFFGAIIDNNIYWVSDGKISVTLLTLILVIIPCVYFITGIVKSFKSENPFIKTLTDIFILNFCFAVFVSALEVNILTVRYVIYLLPVFVILSVLALYKNLKPKHFKVFIILFIFLAAAFSIRNSQIIKNNKYLALKDAAAECEVIGLGADDVLIMPFASDSPYYFRSVMQPSVANFDLHKVARNPYGYYYDKSQRKELKKDKSKFIYKKIKEDSVMSQTFANYFAQNVTYKVPEGRYAVIIMYGTDNNAIEPIDKLRKDAKDLEYVDKNLLDVLFKKYMCDIVAMLNNDFKFIQMYKKNNFTYYIYQKI